MFRYRGGWWQEATLVVAFGMITLAAAKGWTAGLDLAVRDFCRATQVTAIEWTAIVLNRFGQGGILAWLLGFGLSALLWWRTRPRVNASAAGFAARTRAFLAPPARWKVFLPWAIAFFLTYITLGPVKIWSMRTSPNSELPNAVEFFNEAARAEGYAMGYPSGHVVNSIVWWGVILLVATRMWTIPMRWQKLMRIAPPIIVLCTTTYLGHHWLTDGMGAIALGLLIDRLIHRFRWREILPG